MQWVQFLCVCDSSESKLKPLVLCVLWREVKSGKCSTLQRVKCIQIDLIFGWCAYVCSCVRVYLQPVLFVCVCVCERRRQWMSQTRILNGAGFLFVSQHLNIIFLWLHKMKRNTKKKTQKKNICTCNHEKTEREREKEGQRKVLRGQQRREGNRPTGITNFNPCS